jgi:hypothetical protein
VRGLDADEKGLRTTETLGGAQSLVAVNESGLYALIFRSRKPSARIFRRWVTTEVLPAIRKQGFYQVPPPEVPAPAPAPMPSAPPALVEPQRINGSLDEVDCSHMPFVWRLRNLHWTHDDYPDLVEASSQRKPGGDEFPPRQWKQLYYTLVFLCSYEAGAQVSSADLAGRLRLECPEFTVLQIQRALPWMLIHRFGVARSNDIGTIPGHAVRGYRNIRVRPYVPRLEAGAEVAS